MPRPELLLAFALATATFAVFPGPALLYTAARTLAHGRRAGLLAVLGIHLGCYVHVAAAVFGLSALLQAIPTAYLALKIAGAVYLVWLGVGMIRSRGGAVERSAERPLGARRALLQSIVVELTNPKVALFFLAFLPQFVDPAAAWPVPVQLLVLGLIVNATFSLTDTAVVFMASAVAGRLGRDGRPARLLRAGAGSVLIGLGVKLATDRA